MGIGEMMTDSRKRSLLKSVTWRVIAFFTTLIIAYMFTGELIDSVSIAVVANLLKFILYYIHERMWIRK